MVAHLATRAPSFQLRSLRVWLIIVILVTQFGARAVAPTKAFDPLTIGGLIALGQLTLDKLDQVAQNAINTAGEQVRQSIDQLRASLKDLIKTLEQTYQDNLNITIDSLDNVTRNKLLEMQTFIEQVNQKLQEDIELIGQETRNVINTAALQVRRLTAELEERLKNLVVVGSEAVVYVVDKTIFNVVFVVALILLGFGLLLFIWLLFSRRLPEGALRPVLFVLMAAYVVLFGALALVPSVRAMAMDATGLGIEKRLEKASAQKPEIVGVDPRMVTIGQTAKVTAYGVGLRPEGKTVTAKIGNQPVPVDAATNQEVALNLSALTVPNGSHELVLLFDGTEGPRAVVDVTRPATPVPPPDLTITGFTLSPASPVHRGNVQAAISVRNQGAGPAGSFVIMWKPYAAHPGISQSFSGLNAGASQTFTFNFANYPGPNTYDSVAIVDPLSAISESNEGNNSLTRRITVQPEPPRQVRVTVTFTQITIHSDADPFASGELWLDFNVGGQTRRWPRSGTKGVEDGKTYTINETFNLTLTEGQRLTIYVNGTDEDSPGFPTFDDNDPMGEVRREYFSADDWGRGNYSIRSTCPDGCYTISYTISVSTVI